MIAYYRRDLELLEALREVARLRSIIDDAISLANGRWDEWGERAAMVADKLDEATDE